MEEMSSMIQQNAGNAEQADSLMKQESFKLLLKIDSSLPQISIFKNPVIPPQYLAHGLLLF